MGRMEEARATTRATLAIWPELTVDSLVGRVGRADTHDRLLVEGLQRSGMPAS
jgi:hypothetical protein